MFDISFESRNSDRSYQTEKFPHNRFSLFILWIMLRLSKNTNFIKGLQSFLLIFFPHFLLSMVVYHGTYFQNWLNAFYSPPNKFILFIVWIILFALLILIFHSIRHSEKKNPLCLVLFILQFFGFFVFLYRVLRLIVWLSWVISLRCSFLFGLWSLYGKTVM